MIPPFDSTGLLPPQPEDQGYRCASEEVEQRFVVDLGSPAWRMGLFRGWQHVRDSVSEVIPSARWWLWGCFVSNHPDPLWGDGEVLSSVVILPVADLPEDGLTEMMLDFLRAAQGKYGVDAAFVFEFPDGTDDYLETLDALDFKWRKRATKGVADHTTKELIPAGFLEIAP